MSISWQNLRNYLTKKDWNFYKMTNKNCSEAEESVDSRKDVVGMSSESRDILSDKTVRNEIETLNSKNHNCNTKKPTSTWMNVFDDWRARSKNLRKYQNII